MERRQMGTVVYEKDGPVARVVLDRPEKANAMNSPLVWDFEECLKEAEQDYGVKVLVVKANGRGFSSGHDVMSGEGFPEFTAGSEAGHPWKGQADLFLWPVLHLWEFQKPTISAVHGYAIGAGTYFALLPDIVVAASDAYFQMPLVQGLALPGAETMIEPWVFMNWHRTYEYLYTAKTIGAEEALRLGMVNDVVAPEELETTVDVMAHQIAQAPLSTLMGVKSLVKRAWEGMGMRSHLQQSTEVMQLVSRAGDVAAWRAENQERGYAGGPRQIVTKRFEEVAAARREGAAEGPERG
jgi:enoyl-CoA hydratase/carnithine racemase